MNNNQLTHIRESLKNKAISDEDFNTLQRLVCEYDDMRNELCLLCGKYKHEYEDWCKGCRWEKK